MIMKTTDNSTASFRLHPMNLNEQATAHGGVHIRIFLYQHFPFFINIEDASPLTFLSSILISDTECYQALVERKYLSKCKCQTEHQCWLLSVSLPEQIAYLQIENILLLGFSVAAILQ